MYFWRLFLFFFLLEKQKANKIILFFKTQEYFDFAQY